MDIEPLAMKKGHWVEGYYYEDLQDGEWCSWIQECNDIVHYKVDKDTLGQFTGLLDNNGNEIYEGDILMFREEENCNDTLVVMWDKGSFVAEYPNRGEGACIRSNYFAAFPEMFRVVGNIHDNPELLIGGAE